MLRRSPIFRAVQSNIVSSGLQPDIHPLLKILWEAAENVTFFAGRVKRRRDSVLIYNASNAFNIRGISQQRANNGVRWLWNADASGKVYRWFSGSPELITTLGAQQDESTTQAATFFDFVHYGNFTLINNGITTPKIYKADAPSLTDYGQGLLTGAVVLRKKLSFILGFGTNVRGTSVTWSDSQNIEDFTPTVSNNAGSLTIDDFDTRIKAASTLGSSNSVYSEDQLGLVFFTNAPYFFGQKTVLDGIGAVSKNAVSSDGNNNFGVGRNGVWWTDGNTYKYIDEGYLHDYLQENVNWAQRSKIFSIRNDFTGCFEFFFPMGAALNVTEGWSFDPRTSGWSLIPAASLKDERRLFEQAILGTLDGKLMLAEAATTASTLKLRTRPLLMQLQDPSGLLDVHNSSKVDEFMLLTKAATSVEVRIGSCDEMLGEYTWDDWQTVIADSKTYKTIKPIPDGVFWKLEFRSIATDWDLDFQGFMLFGQVDGTKID